MLLEHLRHGLNVQRGNTVLAMMFISRVEAVLEPYSPTSLNGAPALPIVTIPSFENTGSKLAVLYRYVLPFPTHITHNVFLVIYIVRTGQKTCVYLLDRKSKSRPARSSRALRKRKACYSEQGSKQEVSKQARKFSKSELSQVLLQIIHNTYGNHKQW